MAPKKTAKKLNKPDALVQNILALLAEVSEKFEPQDREMRAWMLRNFGNPQIVELLEDMTFMMFQVLTAIGQFEPVNGITISKQTRIPKGSVSKITRRLLGKKLIVSESLPNNNKEVLFRRTLLGRELDEAHRAFDEQMTKGFIRFLKKYDDEKLSFLIQLLHDLQGASFLEADSAPIKQPGKRKG